MDTTNSGTLTMTLTYKLRKSQTTTETPTVKNVQKKIDGKVVLDIPIHNDNTDYAEYLEWVAAGNTAEAAD